MADVNADGYADLVRFTPSGTGAGLVHVALNTESGGFYPETQWYPPADAGAEQVCVTGQTCLLADVDGKNGADLVVFAQAYSQVFVALSNGSSGFGEKAGWSGALCANTDTCDVGDVNGDGFADVAAYSSNEQTWVALSNGTNAFAPAQIWSAPPGDNCFGSGGHFCKIFDMDGDGMADLVNFDHGATSPGTAIAYSTGAVFMPEQHWSSGYCFNTEICHVARAHQVADAGVRHIGDLVVTNTSNDYAWVDESIH